MATFGPFLKEEEKRGIIWYFAGTNG